MNDIQWLDSNIVSGMVTIHDVLLNFGVAALCGILLGIERELNRKPNGLRTNMLICLGAAFFTMGSLLLGGENDRARIAAQIVSGIGFLGAGAIMRQGADHITGLTSAAIIWFVAAVGMLAGAGYIWIALGGTVFVLLLMQVLVVFEWWILRGFRVYALEVVAAGNRDVHLSLLASLLAGMNVRQLALEAVHADDDEVRIQVIYWARSRRHRNVCRQIASIPDVRGAKELYEMDAGQI